MTKILLFVLVLLVPTASLQSQDTSRAGQTGTPASNDITLEGCLQGTNGDYTIIAHSGRTYQLQGDTSNLSAYVGHEVQITGPTSGASTMMPGIATEADGTTPRPTLTVKDMKHVSETCRTAR